MFWLELIIETELLRAAKVKPLLNEASEIVAIGHDPNTKAYRGKLDMDSEGYLLPKKLVESKYPGVFIAGDVADRVYKQAVTAAGMGCAAALQAEKYLSGDERP